MRSPYFSILMLFLTAVFHAQTPGPQSESSLRLKAKKIHESVITIDTHNDIDVNNFTNEVNYTQNLNTQVNLPKMEAGGLDVSWLIVYTGQGELNKEGYQSAYQNAMDKFDAIDRLVKKYAPESIELARNSAEVKRIHAAGKKVAMIGVENAYSVGLNLQNIENFHKRGARYMSLAHNGHSQFSDSHTGEADGVWLYNGLSELGEKAVAEMNRVGIMIDISHPSKEANIQTIKLSKAPVIASHSSARALCDVSRNLDDELLQLIKTNGGVVQTVALDQYINLEKYNANNQASQELYKKIAEELEIDFLDRDEISKLTGDALETAYTNHDKILKVAATRKTDINTRFPLVNVRDFVDHIDYLVAKMGIDHVGISSDFDGGGGIEGWEDASETFNVTFELVRRGYSEKDIAKLWGLNLLRVLDKVEAVAQKIQKAE